MKPAALVALALLPILGLTLFPQVAPENAAATTDFWCVACGSRGTADFLLNVSLFLPLGAALRLAGVRPALAALTGLLVSGGIETAQLWMPGRYTSLGDLLANGSGTGFGAVLAGNGPLSVRRPRSLPRQAVMTAVVAAVWIGSALAFRPALPERQYYGQWTADLGRYEVYDGHVLHAAIGDQPAPSWRLGASADARHSLLGGDTITVTFVAGSPPAGLAPIFSIYDDQQDEVMLLGADGDDLVFRLRRRAADLRLESPELRWRGALDNVGADDTVRVAAWRDPRVWPAGGARLCLRAGPRHRCAAPHFAQGWILLVGPAVAYPPAAAAIGAIGVFVFLLAALWWAPHRRARLAGLALLLVVAAATTLL